MMHAAAVAARAYRTGAGHRSLRDQEADVFRRASYVLRSFLPGGPAGGPAGASASPPPSAMARYRALADNRRLWSMVVDLVRDPANQLPVPLRANLVSIGLAVHRELDKDDPDLAFLAEVNDQIAAGLSGG